MFLKQFVLILVLAYIPHKSIISARRFGGLPPMVPPKKYEVKEETGGNEIHARDDTAIPNILNSGKIEEEMAHIQEHMDIPIDTSEMSERELQFHYFKIADADTNNMLDGQELIYYLIHRENEGVGENKTVSEQGHQKFDESDQEHDHRKSGPSRIFSDQELMDVIDPILEQYDQNMDGMIDWHEFVLTIDKNTPVEIK